MPTSIPAVAVLNLTAWSDALIDHASSAEAWRGVESDAATVRGQTVYVASVLDGKGGVLTFDPPRRARTSCAEHQVVAYHPTMDGGARVRLRAWMQVEVKGHGTAHVLLRTHQTTLNLPPTY